ncbi:MAG: exopolysaccharide biosynthesis polyprenyl glycosylphosphotransferase [Candidatus Doudnabacteria bacterium]|nr:exopolysaccharide biosynthesis polyprenyl glycosylphosphotransferase [Candidatus Doudnabacteria bacterium]
MTLSSSALKFWLIIVPTIGLLYVSLWLTILFRYPQGLPQESVNAHLISFSIIYVLWLVSFFVFRFFEQQTFSRLSVLFKALLFSMVANGIIAIVYFYAQPGLILTPRRFLLLHILITSVLLLLWALTLRLLFRNSFVTPVYILTVDNELIDLRYTIENNRYLGFHFVDFISETSIHSQEIRLNSVVIIPDQIYTRPDMWQALYELRTQGIRLLDHKQFHEELLRSIYLPTLNELWFLQNVHYTEKHFYKLVKRVIDILCGLVGTLALIVTFPVVAILIKLSSPGPLFFSQKRIGKDGQPFTLYKYRTMRVDSKDEWSPENDQRITGVVGKFLRKTRLDELPQSLMILKGDMSLVGPRPEIVAIVEELRKQIPFYDERHAVKPGLTGWAQLHVYAGTVEETRRKLQYDLYYIKHRSVLFDIEVILKTISSVLTGSGR